MCFPSVGYLLYGAECVLCAGYLLYGVEYGLPECHLGFAHHTRAAVLPLHPLQTHSKII